MPGLRLRIPRLDNLAPVVAQDVSIATMAEELRKAEAVREGLESLDRLMGSYPEGHGKSLQEPQAVPSPSRMDAGNS
jgi:hypothetical protein